MCELLSSSVCCNASRPCLYSRFFTVTTWKLLTSHRPGLSRAVTHTVINDPGLQRHSHCAADGSGGSGVVSDAHIVLLGGPEGPSSILSSLSSCLATNCFGVLATFPSPRGPPARNALLSLDPTVQRALIPTHCVKLSLIPSHSTPAVPTVNFEPLFFLSWPYVITTVLLLGRVSWLSFQPTKLAG